MRTRDAIVAGAWAAVLGGAPSTVHARRATIRIRGAGRGVAAGLVIADLDLGVGACRYPRLRDLPLAPRVADHVVFGLVAGLVLARRTRD